MYDYREMTPGERREIVEHRRRQQGRGTLRRIGISRAPSLTHVQKLITVN